MNYLVWWVLLKDLRDYAKLQPKMTGVEVRAGTKRPKDPYPCVELIWDTENAQLLSRALKGDFTIWVDCWTKNSDPNPAAGYDNLIALQENILAVIDRWSDDVLDRLGYFIKLSLNGIVSDGEINRPLCASRMVLKMEWKRSD